MKLFIFLFLLPYVFATEECDSNGESLNKYEQRILQAAETNDLVKMAEPIACILRMQNEGQDFSQYLAASFLRPLMGGEQTPRTIPDPRYQKIARALERLTLNAPDSTRSAFISAFSKGDWRFYTLFCQEGDTSYCDRFLPDESRVLSQPPVVAAASLMRLKTAANVLQGEQRSQILNRIRNLYRDIPKSSKLQRKMIDEIYRELFPTILPMSQVS